MFLESMIPGGISRRELRRAIVQVFKRRGESKRVENTLQFRCLGSAIGARGRERRLRISGGQHAIARTLLHGA